MDRDPQLTIVQLTDLHGYIAPHTELFHRGKDEIYANAGGFSRISFILRQLRKDNPGRVLAFDCGDTFFGTLPASKTRGEVLVPLLKELQFEAMTPHWDFAYTPPQLMDLEEKLGYPILAINCYRPNNELAFEPYRISEAGGLRIGVIGLASYLVDRTMPPSYSGNLVFTRGTVELPDYIRTLKEQENVDLVVIISHMGLPQDIQIASEIEGIDLILSGHTHNRMRSPLNINNTLIIQSGAHGSFIGKLDLVVDRKRIAEYYHELITVGTDTEPDIAMEELVQSAISPFAEESSEIVGQTSVPLHRYSILESTMDNIILESIAKLAGTELAFSPGWRYGVPIKPGNITYGDIWNMVPKNPPVSTCELKGSEIIGMLENDLESTFSRDPYNQTGGYMKRCYGLNAYVKIENPQGTRIQELFIQGERVHPDNLYTTAYISSMGVGAPWGQNHIELDENAVEAVARYIRKKGSVGSGLTGSITLV